MYQDALHRESTPARRRFTAQNDEKLRQACSGKEKVKWVDVQSKYFPERSVDILKARWHYLKHRDIGQSPAPSNRTSVQWTPRHDQLLLEKKQPHASNKELVRAFKRSLDACNMRYRRSKKAARSGASYDLPDDDEDEYDY
jgi:hypothetical protein